MKNSFQTSGFTLVELLLVMAIIAVLASLSLAIVNDAQFDANANATRSRITTAHSILQQKLESYDRRRLPIDLAAIGLDRREQREYRRRIISDMINVEMPRRAQNIAFLTTGVTLNTMREAVYPSQPFLTGLRDDNDLTAQEQNDIADNLVAAGSTAFGTRFTVPGMDPVDNTMAYPENGSAYSVAEITFDPSDTNSFPSLAVRRTLSEYLYSILETSNFNGISAVEVLGDRSFADTDGDGFQEFVDSWGNPICFQFEVDGNEDGLVDDINGDGIPDPGLDPGRIGPGIAVRNLRIRLLSTGDGIETITN